MGLNSTPNSDRIHIGIFGKRNAGKSSLINALTNQPIAIVSDVLGTTTDPVFKAMEILPLGPVMIIDTPGIDDSGELGKMRVKKSYQVLNKTDIAILVVEKDNFSDEDTRLLEKIKAKNIPYIICHNKCDNADEIKEASANEIYVSAKNGTNIDKLRELLGTLNTAEAEYGIIGDMLNEGDHAILVIPIDKAAPKGRLILPQQQTIRDLLDHNCIATMVKDDRLSDALQNQKEKPAVVITDSQAFGKVSKIVPQDIYLTSFSILMARHKGTLEDAVRGIKTLDTLNDGDKVLISEGCTHHRQCGDIGTQKLPKWILEYTKKNVEFEFSSGTDFPEDLSGYKLIIHCGGCMLNEREMKYRLRCAKEQNVPMTNYGIAIAFVNGILKRSVEIFPDIKSILE